MLICGGDGEVVVVAARMTGAQGHGCSWGARLPGRQGEQRRVGSRGGLGWSLVGGIGSGGMRGSRGFYCGGGEEE